VFEYIIDNAYPLYDYCTSNSLNEQFIATITELRVHGFVRGRAWTSTFTWLRVYTTSNRYILAFMYLQVLYLIEYPPTKVAPCSK
jgi:hypothetical protein